MNETYPQERHISPLKASKATEAELGADAPVDISHPSVFEELFIKHWASINRLLTRLTGDPTEAEDLAMETFYRLYQRPPKTGTGSNLPGWLYRVATNLGLHSIRSFQRRQHYELEAGKATLQDPPDDQPPQLLDRQEAHQIARLVLSQMRPRQAQLLSLRYSSMSYQEVARALGLSPTSIGPLLLRAEREFARIYRSISKEEL